MRRVALILAVSLSIVTGEETHPEPLVGWDNQLAGTGGESLPFEVVEAFPGLELNKATDLDAVPIEGSLRYFAVVLEGNIVSFSEESPAVTTTVLFRDETRNPYSLAFDPAFPARPYLYVSSNCREDDFAENFVSRFTVTVEGGDVYTIDSESRLDLIRWETDGHNGCDLKFGPDDGLLYISTGDGEAPGDPANVGQVTDNFLGSMLRIDVREATVEQPYKIPEDNPFLEHSAIIPGEVWAYGLRNPWKMAFHPTSHELFVGDNGDEHWELVRKVTAGSNHGWSAFEGSHLFRPSTPLSPPQTELTIPVLEQPHTEMRSVIGGLFYRGNELPQLSGQYVYGCYFTRKLWAFEWNGNTASNPRRIADTGLQLVGFTEGRDREILVVTLDGGIQKLVSRSSTEAPKPIPRWFSETGFDRGGSVFSYEINEPLWEDGMAAERVMALPAGTEQINALQGERQNKSWKMPNGAGFARTVSLDGAKIETQVMHLDSGEWKFLSYRWREDGADAELVPADGITDEKTGYRFASQAECASCHTQKSFFTLGLSTEQMRVGDQIERLKEAGVFWKGRHPSEKEGQVVPAFADDLDSKARAYLHTNCAHCHRETGLGGRAQFQMLHWLPLEETGMINAQPLVGMPGVEGSSILVPGEPDKSEIYRRMVTETPGMRMPLIGSHKVDEDAAELIRKWISEMPQ